MAEVIRIKKGLNIRLQGKADKIFVKAERSATYGIRPTDFPGLVPKLTVKPDDRVKAGTSLFHDKYRPEVQFTSPVSGTVLAINRGERRRVLEVVIQADTADEHEVFLKASPASLSRSQIVENLLKSGLWPAIRQRPYNIVANPTDEPKAIFISGFDTAPLAPDYDFVVKGCEADFQTGIDALRKLTQGKIHLNLNSDYPASKVFTGASGVQINYFKGPHPAGNVGIQIHHLDPINKGEVAWTINPQHVIVIGRLFNQGIYEPDMVVALTGSEVLRPRYYKLKAGAAIANIVADNIKAGIVRYISGNVLTGTRITADGHLGFYDSQLTVIPEGNHFEFLGWAMPGLHKFSVSRSFFSWLQVDREFRLDTNLNGGIRPFVVSGQYEKVLPMDIYPVHLLKAILAEDIDQMENLGIYEVAEEDFALCEFVCTSKIEVQSIIRKGLDMMVSEMS